MARGACGSSPLRALALLCGYCIFIRDIMYVFCIININIYFIILYEHSRILLIILYSQYMLNYPLQNKIVMQHVSRSGGGDGERKGEREREREGRKERERAGPWRQPSSQGA